MEGFWLGLMRSAIRRCLVELKTHKKIDPSLSGEVVELKEGYAKVVLATSERMVADERGLVHGGFTFSAADFAAMAAVNEPYVVLVGADVRFLAPVVVGDRVEFEARVKEQESKKAKVEVVARVGAKEVFRGLFQTFAPQKHILDRS